MSAAPVFEIASPPDEQRMLLYMPWKEYVLLRDLLDGPALKMTYLRGALEFMSPSREHEIWKTTIARLLEHYAYVRGIDLRGYGSTTFKKELEEIGAEPDECYVVGKPLGDYPEIVLEVVHKSPLLNKLDVYRGFGVPEVWVFRNGAFTVHVLDAATGRYEVRPRSTLLPDLDFEILTRYALREDTLQALREFEKEIAR